ncbi:MAG: glycosyltransferase family 4 protein [Roseovarius sp.]|nr:glycosyltransferase family 4 protein [Roseovarius sp.]
MNRGTLVFVVAGPEGYGVRRVWDLLFRTLSDSGHDIVIAVLDRDCLDRWKTGYPGASVIAPPFSWRSTGQAVTGVAKYWGILKRGTSQLRLVRWLLSVQSGNGARAIILQGPIESMLCGMVARRAGIPALWFVPNAISKDKVLDINRRIYRFLFRYANVVPVSNSHFTDSTFGPGGFRRHVVHLGVDIDSYAPVPRDGGIRAALGIPDTAVVIGVFARMTRSKGQQLLLRAIAGRGEDIHVILCGGPTEGPYYEMLLSDVAALDLTDRVHFAGMQTDLVPYYAACDVIGNLLIGSEGFGLTVVEAMACGKPVLAHAAGGPSETIVDGVTGWLIPACDVDSIAAGLTRALRDRERWAEMGRAGRARAETSFSARRFKTEARAVVEAEIVRADNQPPSGVGEVSG